MGDMSAEPSMEDILSSIKRIIAEEGEVSSQSRGRRGEPAARLAAVPKGPPPEPEGVLELRESMAAAATPPAEEISEPVVPASLPVNPPEPPSSIVSDTTAQATRGALDALSRLVVKPEPASDGTLEGLVRDLLRPMLQQWLDANLPALVEQMVQREIAKITNNAR